jgi:hypothetical protein
MQNDTRIAVDLAKAVFEVAVSNRPGSPSRAASTVPVSDVLRPASFTALDRSSFTLERINLITCASGRTSSHRPTSTTRRRWRSPTKWLESSGRCGAASRTAGRPARTPEHQHHQPRRR